jgi:MSHA biogenesis protein MshK
MVERLIMFTAASVLAGAALAQPLADPTRPPTQGAAQPRQGDAPQTRLQSVLVSPGRSVAVIDGRAVRLGERIGDATVVSIEPAEVTLQRGAATERLTLLPGLADKKVRP